MSRFNLVDEKWIPVRFPDGTRDELGIQDTLLRANDIAAIEDSSPLVVASLHRFLLAILYRALEGPTDIEQAKALFKAGLPGNKITDYLERWQHRFWLFDEEHPFYQVPSYAPKETKGRKQWRSWTVIAAEHNADNAKVLFDHVAIDNAGIISAQRTAQWLLACQTFALGGGNSDFQYTKGAPSASAVMAIPLGSNLHDTLLLSLVPENREILHGDHPVWEQEPEPLESLRRGVTRIDFGWADRYTWRSRSIRFNADDEGGVAELVFASGVGCEATDRSDPMLGYRINAEKGKLPIQFRERGFWRDFDSLLPDTTDKSHSAPLVIEHAVELTRSCRSRFPRSVMVLGQANNKAKIEFWRQERFALPGALAGDKSIRCDIRHLLDTAEDTQKALWSACSSYARDLLSRGDRKLEGKDINGFVAQVPSIPCYWSTLEATFHEVLQAYTLETNPDEVELKWLQAVRAALKDSWERHRASMSMGDAWAVRALVKAERPISRKIKELNKTIADFEKSLNKENL